MTNQTIELLKECNSGCKMALNSIRQIREFVENEKQAKVIDDYCNRHEELEKSIGEELAKYDKTEESPSLMAAAMSWISTEMKMMLRDDKTQISKLMMDGCNMGIQSVGEYLGKYQSASPESIALARKLIKCEEDFMDEMKQFL